MTRKFSRMISFRGQRIDQQRKKGGTMTTGFRDGDIQLLLRSIRCHQKALETGAGYPDIETRRMFADVDRKNHERLRLLHDQLSAIEITLDAGNDVLISASYFKGGEADETSQTD